LAEQVVAKMRGKVIVTVTDRMPHKCTQCVYFTVYITTSHVTWLRLGWHRIKANYHKSDITQTRSKFLYVMRGRKV